MVQCICFNSTIIVNPIESKFHVVTINITNLYIHSTLSPKIFIFFKNIGLCTGPCEDGFGNHDKVDTSDPNVTIINQPGNAKSQHGLYPIKPSSPFGLVSTVGSPRARNKAKLIYKEKKLKHII
ncbi:unnamed protein product [Brassica rapa subsp. narinosa]